MVVGTEVQTESGSRQRDLLLTMGVLRGNVVSDGAKDDVNVHAREEKQMSSIERPPAIVRWILRLAQASALDRPVRALGPSLRPCSAPRACRYCTATASVYVPRGANVDTRCDAVLA